MSSYCLKHCALVNAMGNTMEQQLAAYQAGSSAGMQTESGLVPELEMIVGRVQSPLPPMPAEYAQFDTRNNRLLLAALESIETDVASCIEQYGHERIAVIMGTSTSGIAEGEEAAFAKMHTGHFPPEYHYQQQSIGNPALFLQQYLGLDNVAYTVSTACSSSARVFSSGQQLLALGLADAVIVGGADALCKLTTNGFKALEATSSSRCKPFSSERDGINIGEGAALFVMTADAGGIQLKAVASSSDAHHISAPDPEATGAITAMTEALTRAELLPQDIFYINLHGTATQHNDAMEAKAFNHIFDVTTKASSSKPLTGHTLGAAGAMEVGLCWALLKHSQLQPLVLAPQISDGEVDPKAKPAGLLMDSCDIPATGNLYMQSNSFAFGGSNISIIIGREDA